MNRVRLLRERTLTIYYPPVVLLETGTVPTYRQVYACAIYPEYVLSAIDLSQFALKKLSGFSGFVAPGQYFVRVISVWFSEPHQAR